MKTVNLSDTSHVQFTSVLSSICTADHVFNLIKDHLLPMINIGCSAFSTRAMPVPPTLKESDSQLFVGLDDRFGVPGVYYVAPSKSANSLHEHLEGFLASVFPFLLSGSVKLIAHDINLHSCTTLRSGAAWVTWIQQNSSGW